MMFKTHFSLGLLVGLIAVGYFQPQNQILFLVLVAVASIFPDIDLPDSKIGRLLKPISTPLSFLFEHRGFFHGLIAASLFAISIFFISGSKLYAYAVAIGYISHLAIDALTYSGIMFLHPLSRFKVRGIVRTGTITDFALFVLFSALSLWKLLNL